MTEGLTKEQVKMTLPCPICEPLAYKIAMREMRRKLALLEASEK